MEGIVGHLHWSHLRLLLKMYISAHRPTESESLEVGHRNSKETPLMSLMLIKVERLLVRN